MRPGFFSVLAMTGTAVISLAVVYAARIYRGKRGERYSLLNHFISELGEVGVSKGAWAFNAGLFACGVLLTPFVLRLGLELGSLLAWIGTAAGVIACLGVAAVGLFPMNNLKAHIPAAMTFFRAGLGMVLLMGLAIQFQPDGEVVVPRLANLLSLLAVAAFSSFLLLPVLEGSHRDAQQVLDPDLVPERPHFWWSPFLEWMVFFTTILWLFGMAVFV
jgi:hypothetical membrane protein